MDKSGHGIRVKFFQGNGPPVPGQGTGKQIQLHRQEPALLRKLRRALQSREGIRSVLASSSRLWQLAEAGEDTSPFLDGFTPPLYIGTLSDDEAGDVIRQSQLPGESRPTFPDPEIDGKLAASSSSPMVPEPSRKKATIASTWASLRR